MRTYLRAALVAIAIGAAYFAATGARAYSPFSAPAANGTAAPEFTGIDQWLNSQPLTMRSLRGKVVLVDFWTYSCIN
ncbi:hypothetical protein ACIKQA_19400, partial [Acinetobacter baumannii]